MALRSAWHQAWQTFRRQEPLSPLQQQMVSVIGHYPQWHAMLEQSPKRFEDHHWPDDTNPFLTLGIHLALVEQIETDRPAGIRDLYHQLLAKYQDPTVTQQRMLDCLFHWLQDARRQGPLASPEDYLRALREQ